MRTGYPSAPVYLEGTLHLKVDIDGYLADRSVEIGEREEFTSEEQLYGLAYGYAKRMADRHGADAWDLVSWKFEEAA